jgi:fumarate reductase subunit D
MTKSSEPLWWSLFGAGGVISAMLLPVTLILIGIAVPAGWVTEQGLYELVRHPLTRLYLFVVISLSLFHGAHRTLFTLVDLGLKSMRRALAVILHIGAFAGTVLAAVILSRIG